MGCREIVFYSETTTTIIKVYSILLLKLLSYLLSSGFWGAESACSVTQVHIFFFSEHQALPLSSFAQRHKLFTMIKMAYCRFPKTEDPPPLASLQCQTNTLLSHLYNR